MKAFILHVRSSDVSIETPDLTQQGPCFRAAVEAELRAALGAASALARATFSLRLCEGLKSNLDHSGVGSNSLSARVEPQSLAKRTTPTSSPEWPSPL